MKTYTIRESHVSYGSLLFCVLSPSGKKMFLGYNRQGKEKYHTTKQKAQSLADAFTYCANFAGMDIAKILDDLEANKPTKHKSKSVRQRKTIKRESEAAKLSRDISSSYDAERKYVIEVVGLRAELKH